MSPETLWSSSKLIGPCDEDVFNEIVTVHLKIGNTVTFRNFLTDVLVVFIKQTGKHSSVLLNAHLPTVYASW